MAQTVVVPKVTLPGTNEWLKWHLDGVRQGALQIAADSRPFIHSVRELQEHRAWELYFDDEPKTWERFCSEAIKAEPAFVAIIDEGVKVLEERKHQGPITKQMAIDAAKKPKQLNDNGEKGKDSYYNIIARQGTSRDYLAARIARDRPDILEEMKAGKYRSVRAAAIDAGIIKVLTPVEKAKKAFLRLEEEERMEFAMWLHDPANFHDDWN